VTDDTDCAVVVDRDEVTLILSKENGLLVFESPDLMPVLLPQLEPVVVRDETPKPVIVAGDTARTLVIAGFKGDKGEPGEGAGSTYTFLQPTAATEWNIEHNLNRFPSVTVVDSAGNLAVGGVTYVDANNIDLYFSAAFAGTAYLN